MPHKYMVTRRGLAFGKMVRVSAIYWWLKVSQQYLISIGWAGMVGNVM